jgi:hypothetical protein
MKNPFYYVSWAAALILLTCILVIHATILSFDRQSSPVAMGSAMLVLVVHIVVLVAYPFRQTRALASLVKAVGLLSMLATVVVAAFHSPNKAIPHRSAPDRFKSSSNECQR